MKDIARHAAYRALLRVEERGTYSNLAIKEEVKDLHAQDRRFATELVYCVLERRMTLDELILRLSKAAPRDAEMRCLLRLGIAQVLYLTKVPDSAACNETVNMAKELGFESRAGYVNGLLREVMRRRDRLPLPPPERDYAQYLATLTSWPRWIVDRLMARMSVGEVESLLNHRFGRGMWVRPNRFKVTEEEWRQHLERMNEHSMVRSRIAPDAWRMVSQGDLTRDSWFLSGRVAVQREGSQLAVRALDPQPGWRVLDACAAPGGKSAYMAQLMENRGSIVAFDLHPHRVELIQKTAARLGAVIVEGRTQDAATVRPELVGKLDAVLVDAPCSGYGVVSGKPEIKYRHGPEDIRGLNRTQLAILTACSRYVKPGGRLMYCTCTFLKEENEDVVEAFLRAHPDFALDPFTDLLPDALKARGAAGMLQLWPHRDKSDGFFMARLRRREG